MDGSTDQETTKPTERPGCWFNSCPRLADHEPCCSSHGHPLCHACYRRTHFVERCNCGRPECQPKNTTDRPTTSRPVVSVAACDELDAAAGSVQGSLTVLEKVLALQAQVEADAATIGTLSAAVAKVAQLHQGDGDGWCRACQTIGWPCPTVLALGVGQ